MQRGEGNGPTPPRLGPLLRPLPHRPLSMADTNGSPMEETDWKRELRRRDFEGLPSEITAEQIRAMRLEQGWEGSHPDQGSAALAGAARIVLVTALLAALHWWPYASDCGASLAGLVGAQGMIAVGGLWAAVFAWQRRLAKTHVLALALLLTGLVLVAAQVLPRTGHVTIAGVHATAWRCAAR